MDLAGKIPPAAPLPAEPPSGVRRRGPAGAPAGHEPSAGHLAPVPASVERAFTEFVKAQVKRTPAYARRLRIPVDRAEDIRQRSLAKLFPLIAEIAPEKWEAWLWDAMRLRTLHYFRGVRRARRHAPEVLLLLQSWQSRTPPDVDVHQRECARELLALLDALTPVRREVVCLHLIDDLSLKDVAATLGIPEDTAWSHWRRAALDMADAWERRRAKDRSNVLIAAFFAASAAVVAFWRRLFGRRAAGTSPRPGRGLLACAACVLLVVAHEEPGRPVSRDERPGPVAVLVPPSSPDGDEPPAPAVPAAPIAPAAPKEHESTAPAVPVDPARHARAAAVPPSRAVPRGAASAQRTAEGERDRRDGVVPSTADHKAAAHRYLKHVAQLRQQGRRDAARNLLTLYRLSFPDDPLPVEHASLAAALATP